jgi:sec-independent protein translocase protein TatA
MGFKSQESIVRPRLLWSNIPLTTIRRQRRQGHALEASMFGSLGFTELLIILAIIVFIFGTSRIPELGKGLGEGIKNFKKAIKGGEEDEKKG